MNEHMEKFKQYSYYIVIFLVSLISLAVIPFFGKSKVNGGFVFPTDAAGWTIYITLRLIVSTINVLIFDAWIKQAKLNVKDNPKYKEACEILHKVKNKKYKPMGPTKFFSIEYGKKASSLFITSLLTTIVLTQCILTYDYISAISYGITLLFGCIFGFMEMKKVELYWTETFYDYALEVQSENLRNEEMDKENMAKTEGVFEENLEGTKGLENSDSIFDSKCDIKL